MTAEAVHPPAGALPAPAGERPVDWPGDPTAEAIEAQCLWRELGLTDQEFARIREGLGRIPNWTELGMFSVAWSEHCAYKHSKKALAWLPTTGERLAVGPGENAGVLDLGHGWGLAVRLESHNHPSYVEPYQGAATGVGGIVRDVLAAGARPVALLDALRFGRPEGHRANRRLLEQVVAGIAGYGNTIGVPTVGGEVAFHPCYERNPLVNVMCVGWVRLDSVARARAEGPGHPVYLVGARTGRDGIHGAGLLASRSFDEEASGQRVRVQVGDPLTEKLLIEACLEALQTGGVVGIQDLGAAGITAAASEMAARAGTGMELDLDRVPLREPGMTPFERMLSESQERMMLVVDAARAGAVEAVLRRWELAWARIGTVTDTGRLRVRQEGRLVADVPARLLAAGAPLAEPPQPRRPAPVPPARYPAAGQRRPGAASAARQLAKRITTRLLQHLSSADGASRAWIYHQFDHMVGLRTLLPPGHDAAVLRWLPDDGARGLPRVALSVDGAEWLAPLSPYLAAVEAVLEGARNVAAVGARPIGITNGLNLGNPERPEVMQQLADTVAGLADACRALGIPVTGGNVSLYNETAGRGVLPTAIVGTVGLLEGAEPVPSGFQRAGDVVVLIGEPYFGPAPDRPAALSAGPQPGGPAASAELAVWPVDFHQERRALDCLAQAARQGLLRSSHDLSRLGLAHGLCEAALLAAPGADGFSVELPLVDEWPPDPEQLLLGAGGPCWVASVPPDRLERLQALGREKGVAVRPVGRVAPGYMELALQGAGSVLRLPTDAIRRAWETGLTRP